jgi:hypothetical protein
MTANDATRWDAYWSAVGNEDWLVARRLLELSPRVRSFFASHFEEVQIPIIDDGGRELGLCRCELTLDWKAAAEHIDDDGFSSTEHRLARLVAALTAGEPVHLASLTLMNSWSTDVWRVLTEWGTDGRSTLQERR